MSRLEGRIGPQGPGDSQVWVGGGDSVLPAGCCGVHIEALGFGQYTLQLLASGICSGKEAAPSRMADWHTPEPAGEVTLSRLTCRRQACERGDVPRGGAAVGEEARATERGRWGCLCPGQTEALSKGQSSPVQPMQQSTHSGAGVGHAGWTAWGRLSTKASPLSRRPGVLPSIIPGLVQCQDWPGRLWALREGYLLPDGLLQPWQCPGLAECPRARSLTGQERAPHLQSCPLSPTRLVAPHRSLVWVIQHFGAIAEAFTSWLTSSGHPNSPASPSCAASSGNVNQFKY